MTIAHEALGASMAEVGGLRLPRHYGDPAGEYAAARDGAVVIDRADRVVLRVSGRDPVRMLQGLITNDLASAADGVVVYAAFLTPKGKMVADARLLRRGGVVLVESAAGAQAGLREHLGKYVPPLFARVEERSGLAVLGVYGERALAVADAVVNGEAADPAQATSPGSDGGILTLPASDVAEDAGRDLLVAEGEVAEVWDALVAAGARPAGHGTLEVLRIEAGRPRWGAELNEGVIPLEAGLKERAISTSKGCYTGQEVIVRILHRGHVNRELRG
ncbi:MAG TPA: hypothetical protein VF832_10700, partial [Longimicrobiales bacterium]